MGNCMPALTVRAIGIGHTGDRWVLWAGGTADDFFTLLESTDHDGQSSQGGMGGPPLYAGSALNVSIGAGAGDAVRVVVRAANIVTRVLVVLARGERVPLTPVATDDALRIAFFVALLPPGSDVATVSGFDSNNRMVA